MGLLHSQDIQFFSREGFIRIPNVFTAKEIQALRTEIDQICATPSPFPGDTDIYKMDIMCRYPQFSWILRHSPLLYALKHLLGPDFIFLHETAIHYHSPLSEWHKDTSSQEGAGRYFHWHTDCVMLQCAIYLQDNHPAYGGGLNVIPGSHILPDRYLNPQNQSYFQDRPEYCVPSKAGDLVCFNLRLDHKATPIPPQLPPGWPRKIALFFIASVNNRYVQQYEDFIFSRQDYRYLENHADFAPHLKQEAIQAQFHLSSRPTQRSTPFQPENLNSFLPETASFFWEPLSEFETVPELTIYGLKSSSLEHAQVAICHSPELLSRVPTQAARVFRWLHQANLSDDCLNADYFWVSNRDQADHLIKRGVSKEKVMHMPLPLSFNSEISFQTSPPPESDSHVFLLVCAADQTEQWQKILSAFFNQFGPIKEQVSMAVHLYGSAKKTLQWIKEYLEEQGQDPDLLPDLCILEEEYSLENLSEWIQSAHTYLQIEPGFDAYLLSQKALCLGRQICLFQPLPGLSGPHMIQASDSLEATLQAAFENAQSSTFLPDLELIQSHSVQSLGLRYASALIQAVFTHAKP